MSNSYTEDHLVEQPAIQLMQHELDWDVVNCYGEREGGVSKLGRDGKREVVLTNRLKPALQRLNPDLPVAAIEGAVEEMSRDCTAKVWRIVCEFTFLSHGPPGGSVPAVGLRICIFSGVECNLVAPRT